MILGNRLKVLLKEIDERETPNIIYKEIPAASGWFATVNFINNDLLMNFKFYFEIYY